MAFTFKEKLPTPDQIREEYPWILIWPQSNPAGTNRSAVFSPENPINFWLSSAPALQTTRTLSVTTYPAWHASRKKWQTV